MAVLGNERRCYITSTQTGGIFTWLKGEQNNSFNRSAEAIEVSDKSTDWTQFIAGKKNGSQVSGPVPLPTKKEVVTILRAVHKYKDSREQFEQRTHKRLIDIITPTPKTVDALQRLEMPAGVCIDIKMKNK